MQEMFPPIRVCDSAPGEARRRSQSSISESINSTSRLTSRNRGSDGLLWPATAAAPY